MSAQKCVVLGVSGCIAAYKACEILRGLQKAGCRVKVLMTHNACEFVGQATFKALSRETVAIEQFAPANEPVHHVSLAKEADLFLVAPATANIIAKMACGIADDLFSTTALACEAPVLIAPAMNEAMWHAQATQENIARLQERGARFIMPGSGYLACGDKGDGRLAEVDEIVAAALDALGMEQDLAGKRVLITAGPTHEAIDPVRYLGNRSSGKTGYALAEEARDRGAQVTLVAGPTALADPEGLETLHVNSALEMLEACKEPFAAADIAIFCAAVADFRPAAPSPEKIKKDGDKPLCLELVQNPDILKTLAANKRGTFVVGFAAETENLLENAKKKLIAKHADMIVANDVSGELGFGSDDNKVFFVSEEGIRELDVMDKGRIAKNILNEAAKALLSR